MNLAMLPDEALEKIHEAIREAYEESHDLAVKSNPDWKEWRDSLEALLTERGVDFDHLALQGEPAHDLDDEDDDKDDDHEDGEDDDDRARKRGRSDDADDNQDDDDDDDDDQDEEDDDNANKRRR
jgi:hypothetical protein